MRRVAGLAVAGLILAGCTTTVSGHAPASAPPVTSPSSTAPSSTPGSSTPAPSTSAAGGVDIGDPTTADFCRAVQLPDLRTYGTATIDGDQIAASCYITISRSGTAKWGANVTAMPPLRAQPRASGVQRTVEGLPVVALHPTPYDCERDIWLASTVLTISAQDLGSSNSGLTLCRIADRITSQVAHAIRSGPPPRRPLASPSLVSLDMCRGLGPRDLAKAPGGGTLLVAPYNYKTFCHATNSQYILGAQVAFRKAATKPQRVSNSGGHRLEWFDPVRATSTVCDVSSVQKPTADRSLVEAVDIYVIAKAAPIRGQRLCGVLTTEAVTVLNRLGLK